MTVLASDLKWYGSAVMPDDDTGTGIGGAIDHTKKVDWGTVDVSPGIVQIVSSTTVDTTQTIAVSYRNTFTPTAVQVETHTLNGQTPFPFVSNMERLLKAVKNAITQGDVAVEMTTAVRTGTAQGGSPDTVILDAAASGVDQAFQAMVIRITAGTGVGQIREIIAYVGSTKTAQVSYAWAVQPDATSVFRISRGMVFEKSPFEIFQVRRPFFNSAADVPGGVVKNYYEKVFAQNMNAVSTLQSALVHEQADLTGECTFGLEATTSGAGTNGGGNNRQVAPAAITFDNGDKNVAGGTLGAGNIPGAGTTSSIGVWLKLTRQPGDTALNQPVTMRIQGQSS